MLKKVRIKSIPLSRTCTKSCLGAFWAETDPAPKFHGNLLRSFCVSLVTNQPRNKGKKKKKKVNNHLFKSSWDYFEHVLLL